VKLKIFIFLITLAFHTSLLDAGSFNVQLNAIPSIITVHKISILAYATGMFAALACVGFFAREPSEQKEKIITFGGTGVLTLIISAIAYNLLSKSYTWCAFAIMPMLLLLFPYALPIKKYNGTDLTFFERLITGIFLASCLNIMPQLCGIAGAYCANKLLLPTSD
jgi:hypothetical protein